MKKIVTYIMAFTMAALVFYSGAGVTIFLYCCNECRLAGTEALLNDKCCEIHRHDHAYKLDCEHEHEREGEAAEGCKIKSLDLDWSAQDITTSHIQLAPAIISLLPNQRFLLSACLPRLSNHRPSIPGGPPLTPPRDYLSLLTVLLI